MNAKLFCLLKDRGFTLIELLITISIIALLSAMGIPSFVQTIKNNRLTTNINELTTSLNFARSEAIKRGIPVTVAKTNAEWEGGWNIFTDSNENFTIDGSDQLLRTYDNLPTGFTLRGTTPAYTNRITFQATGISANGSFVLCENSDGNNLPETNTSKLIIINVVGRVRMGGDGDSNGIPEKNDGTEIASCTISPFT